MNAKEWSLRFCGLLMLHSRNRLSQVLSKVIQNKLESEREYSLRQLVFEEIIFQGKRFPILHSVFFVPTELSVCWINISQKDAVALSNELTLSDHLHLKIYSSCLWSSYNYTQGHPDKILHLPYSNSNSDWWGQPPLIFFKTLFWGIIK